MRTITLNGFGGTIYSAGASFQELQLRDNARTEAGGVASFLVQESDGASKFTLEDGSGSIILEA